MSSADVSPQLSIHSLDFTVGDWVTRYDSVFPGKVIAVHPSIDQIDVEYPTGWERQDPEDLIVLPVFHDSLGTTKHNVLQLSRINQNLRARHIKNGQVEKFFPQLTREDHLSALANAYATSSGNRHKKIGRAITHFFLKSEWENYIQHKARVNKIAQAKKKTLK